MLALDQFADILRVNSRAFVLNEPTQESRAADGTIYSASNGAAMWQGSIGTVPTLGQNGKRSEALLNLLRGPGRTFLMRDMTYVGPQLDPTGAILANRTLTLSAVEPARIKIAGFPPEVLLQPGDMIGWQYGANPVRYALHQVSPLADYYGYAGSGVSDWIDLLPNVRGNPQAGDPVQLVKPVCKALIVPGSIQGGMAEPGLIFSGWSFDWRQTLR